MDNALEKEISELISIGKHEQTFERFGKKFTFKSLSGEENLECIRSVSEEVDDLSRITKLGLMLVSKSLCKIENKAISSKDCYKLLSNCQKIFVDEMTACYEELREKQQEKVEKKYGKLTSQLKEEAENIMKANEQSE